MSNTNNFSSINAISIMGGYLNGLHIDFSDRLNTIIGGRGVGKSTLIECIRYALELQPLGKNALKIHKDIIWENIGKPKAAISLNISSDKMGGAKYKITRRYGEPAYVRDEQGDISFLRPRDLLPDIEIYGQNEIYEIAQDKEAQSKLLSRFISMSDDKEKEELKQKLNQLKDNRIELLNMIEKISSLREDISELPKLLELTEKFKLLGIDDTLKLIPLLEKEKILKKQVEKIVTQLEKNVLAVSKNIIPPDINFEENQILPHSDILNMIKFEYDELKNKIENIMDQMETECKESKDELFKNIEQLNKNIRREEELLEEKFKDIPSGHGKSGYEIGVEYQSLLQSVERLKSKASHEQSQKILISDLIEKRIELLIELSDCRSRQQIKLESSMKSLNEKLINKLRLVIKPGGNRFAVIQFLLNCQLENVGEKRLAWIHETDDFSPFVLSKLIQGGEKALIYSSWKITPTLAAALSKLPQSKIMELQELEMPDIIDIELNTAITGKEIYRSLEKLSTGQKCTAMIHLMLLNNKDPLIMDQPEDNLDNGFIASRIVSELCLEKTRRQFIFSTHNANIPVYGEAEWIGILEVIDGEGQMPNRNQGSIDSLNIREKAADILEGGEIAFNKRKLKYGY